MLHSVPIIDHAIVFGLGQSKEERKILARSWSLCNPQKFLEPACKACCRVTREDIQYVAGYCQKKLTGMDSFQYGDRIPPFQRSSSGLGLDKFKENIELYTTDDHLSINLWNGSHVSMPKYYKDKLDIDICVSQKLEDMRNKCVKLGWDYDELSKTIPRWKLKRLIDTEYTYYRENEVKNHLESYFVKKSIKRN